METTKKNEKIEKESVSSFLKRKNQILSNCLKRKNEMGHQKYSTYKKKKRKELSKKKIQFFIKKENIYIYIYIYKKRKEEDSEPLTYQKALRLLPRKLLPDHVLIQMRSKLIQIKIIELNAITERLRNRKEKIQKMKKIRKRDLEFQV